MSIVIITAAAAILGPLLAYLATIRKLSGRIGTSDASELWKESGQMRADYRAQIATMQKTIDGLRERVAQLETDNALLYRETLELKSRLIDKLRDRVVVLEDVNNSLQAESSAMKARLQDTPDG